MDIRSRILKSRLLEKMLRAPAYSEALGLIDRSGFRSGGTQPQERRETEAGSAPADPQSAEE